MMESDSNSRKGRGRIIPLVSKTGSEEKVFEMKQDLIRKEIEEILDLFTKLTENININVEFIKEFTKIYELLSSVSESVDLHDLRNELNRIRNLKKTPSMFCQELTKHSTLDRPLYCV